MKALGINQWRQLPQEEEIPRPKIGKDEALVQVYVSSINPVDQFSMAGYMKDRLSLPFTPGTDFAGEVAEVGAEVTHVKPGDAVYGLVPMRGGLLLNMRSSKRRSFLLNQNRRTFPIEDLESALAFNQQSAEPGKVVLTLS